MMRRARLRRCAVCWLVLSPLVVLALFPFAVMLSTALKSTAGGDVLPAALDPAPLELASFLGDVGRSASGHGDRQQRGDRRRLGGAGVAGRRCRPPMRWRGCGSGRNRPTGVFLLVSQMLAPVLLILGLFRLAAAIPFGDGTLVNTRIGVIVIYAAFQLAFSVWMLAAYFAAIPTDIEEAAWIDGAVACKQCCTYSCRWRYRQRRSARWWHFVAGWNEYVVALTMLRDPDKQTVTLQVVNLVSGRYSVTWNEVMAAALVATLPVAIVFSYAQRYLVRGLTLGAVK